MWQTRRLAMATDPNGRSGARGAALVGYGGGDVVDDHARQRSGTGADADRRPARAAERTARRAMPSGQPRTGASAPSAPVSLGLAVAAGAIDSRAAAAGAPALGTGTLASDS